MFLEVFHGNLDHCSEFRRLIIPPHLAYGDAGIPDTIPGVLNGYNYA